MNRSTTLTESNELTDTRSPARLSSSMEEPIATPPSPQDAGKPASIVGYLLSGGVAALVNYSSRFMFSTWFPFEVAVTAAYAMGMLTGFLLMRRFAFRPSSQTLQRQVLGYCLVNGLAVLQTLVVSSVLARLVLPALDVPGDHEAIAHAAGVAVPVITSYFGHRYLTFR